MVILGAQHTCSLGDPVTISEPSQQKNEQAANNNQKDSTQ